MTIKTRIIPKGKQDKTEQEFGEKQNWFEIHKKEQVTNRIIWD